MENATVGDRPADTELGALAEALLSHVVRKDLCVGRAVLDERGEFEQGEDVVTVHRAVAPRVTVDDEHAFGVAGQPEEPCLRRSFRRQR